MIFCFFTAEEDAELLQASVEQLRRVMPGARVVVAVDRSAARMRVPDGCGVACVQLSRLENKSGPALAFDLDSMAQMLQVMEGAMVRYNASYCVKLDADMWVRDLGPLLRGGMVAPGMPEPDFVAPEGWRPMVPGPGAFRISLWGVRHCLRQVMEGARAGRWLRGMGYAENVFFYHLLGCSRMPVELVPFSSGYLAGYAQNAGGVPEAVLQAGLVHCGEPHRDGSRAGREEVYTRMMLLKAYERA